MIICVSERKPHGKGIGKYFRIYDNDFCRIVCISEKGVRLRKKRRQKIAVEIMKYSTDRNLCLTDMLPINSNCDTEQTIIREFISFLIQNQVSKRNEILVYDSTGAAADEIYRIGRKCREIIVCSKASVYECTADEIYKNYGVCTWLSDIKKGMLNIDKSVAILKNDIFSSYEGCEIRTINILQQSTDRKKIYTKIAEKGLCFTDMLG